MSKKVKNNSKFPTALMVRHIECRPVGQLLPYASNARTHSKSQIRQIAASIREFGFVNPILIGTDSRIVAGHARLRAAQELGMQEVPVIVLEHLAEVQRRALLIADNQLALNAGWDEELLRAELAALEKEEFPVGLIGFDEAELIRLLAAQDAAEGLTDPDFAPPLPALPVSRSGDLWILGEHRLLCGDATSQADLDILMAGETAGMVFTELPSELPARTKTALDPASDTTEKRYADFLKQACTRLIAACRGAIYLCAPSSAVCQAFSLAGGQWNTLLIWVKHRFSRGDSDYQPQYELILYGWPAGAEHYWCGARNQSDVWSIAEVAAKHRHQSMKPVELVERALENSSRHGEAVLDPFAGPGTTLIACERLQRRARLVEIDPRYVDVICQRWEQFRGQPALLDGNGMTLTELAQERQRKAA